MTQLVEVHQREYRIMHGKECGNETPIFLGIKWAIQAIDGCRVMFPSANCEIYRRSVTDWEAVTKE